MSAEFGESYSGWDFSQFEDRYRFGAKGRPARFQEHRKMLLKKHAANI